MFFNLKALSYNIIIRVHFNWPNTLVCLPSLPVYLLCCDTVPVVKNYNWGLHLTLNTRLFVSSNDTTCKFKAYISYCISSGVLHLTTHTDSALVVTIQMKKHWTDLLIVLLYLYIYITHTHSHKHTVLLVSYIKQIKNKNVPWGYLLVCMFHNEYIFQEWATEDLIMFYRWYTQVIQ